MHKTEVLFTIAPAEAETDLTKMESEIKNITMDGLEWRDFKREPVFGCLNRLKALAVVENKTSVSDLEDRICSMKEVQSCDIDFMTEL